MSRLQNEMADGVSEESEYNPGKDELNWGYEEGRLLFINMEGCWEKNVKSYFRQHEWSLLTVSACLLFKWSFSLTSATQPGFLLVKCKTCWLKQELIRNNCLLLP